MVYLKFGIIFFPLIAQKLLLRQQRNHIHCISRLLFLYALSQCSPYILAQRVKDHSQPVRKKIGARGALSWGGGGGSGLWAVAPPLLGNFELSSLKRHPLILRPVLRKSADHAFIYLLLTCENRIGSQLV